MASQVQMGRPEGLALVLMAAKARMAVTAVAHLVPAAMVARAALGAMASAAMVAAAAPVALDGPARRGESMATPYGLPASAATVAAVPKVATATLGTADLAAPAAMVPRRVAVETGAQQGRPAPALAGRRGQVAPEVLQVTVLLNPQARPELPGVQAIQVPL